MKYKINFKLKEFTTAKPVSRRRFARLAGCAIIAILSASPTLLTLTSSTAHADRWTGNRTHKGCAFGTRPSRAYPGVRRVPSTNAACENRGASLVLLTGVQLLYLCENNLEKGHFDMAIGCGGVGKKEDGDGKTPLGTYSLSMPRTSSDGFHLFIPVGYPNEEQQRTGYVDPDGKSHPYTGSNIGLHGPKDIKFLDHFERVQSTVSSVIHTTFNWTQGCMATSSDREIEEIAAFVREHRVRKIHILPPGETPR